LLAIYADKDIGKKLNNPAYNGLFRMHGRGAQIYLELPSGTYRSPMGTMKLPRRTFLQFAGTACHLTTRRLSEFPALSKAPRFLQLARHVDLEGSKADAIGGHAHGRCFVARRQLARTD
jgi:hypothetical protein